MVTQIEKCGLGVLGRPMMKSILMISHFHFISSIIWSKPLGLWCCAFTWWQFEHLETNSAMPFFVTSNQYTYLKSWYIFMELGWIDYLALWASSMILFGFHRPDVQTTYLNTLAHHLPLVQKIMLFAHEHLPSSQAKLDLGLVSLSPMTLIMSQPHFSPQFSFCGTHKSDS